MYFKTDSHWNNRGAYIGYVEILKHLSTVSPDMKPHPLSDFTYTSNGFRTLDIPRLMGLQSEKEEVYSLDRNFETQTQRSTLPLSYGQNIDLTINPVKKSPRLLIYHDSFYIYYLRYLLEPHFSQIVAVPNSPSQDVWSLNWIQYTSPDVVIIEVVERSFYEELFRLLKLDIIR